MGIHFDPRMKLYLLLLANMLLFFHVDLKTEAVITILFLLPFFLSGKWKSGIRFGVIYTLLILADYIAISATESAGGNFISMVSVGVRMMLPCIIAGAYAFSTTGIGVIWQCVQCRLFYFWEEAFNGLHHRKQRLFFCISCNGNQCTGACKFFR